MRCCYNCAVEINADKCPFCGFCESDCIQTPGTLVLGTEIGDGKRYIICRVLGQGGFGITYLGYDKNEKHKIAVKEYFPSGIAIRNSDGRTIIAANSSAAETMKSGVVKFFEEAEILSRYAYHKNIVTVYDFFYENETAYMIMEYIDGANLSDLIKRNGPIDFEALMKLTDQVMDALREIHRDGVLHRDISPSNILVTTDGNVKLIDFGAARSYSFEHSNSLSIILKGGYAPLEQYTRHGNQGPWTDVYALCATMYYCLTGQTPEPATDRIGEDHLAAPSRYGAKLTSEQEAVLLHGMAFLGTERIQSIDELRKELNKCRKASVSERPTEAFDGETAVSGAQSGRREKKSKQLSRKNMSAKLNSGVKQGQKRQNIIIAALTVVISIGVISAATLFALSFSNIQKAGAPIEGLEIINEETSDPMPETSEDTSSKVETTTAETTTEKETAAKETTTAETTTSKETTAKETTKAQTTAAPAAAASVKLNAASYTLKKGYAITLTATVSPSNAADKSVSWSSSNTSVATVSGGKITAKAAGSAAITAKTANGKTASCVITVPGVQSVNVDKTNLTLDVGNSYTFNVTVTSIGDVDKSVTVTSSNTSVATVSGFTVTARGGGNATLTFTSADGVSASCAVTVKAVETTARAAETTAVKRTEPETTTNNNSSPDSVPAATTGGTGYYEGTDQNIKWVLDNGTLTISGNGDMPDYSNNTVPWAFHAYLINKIVITEGISSIGDYAFDSCSSLTSITIPSYVTSIGNYVFNNCDSLTSITIPSSVTSIGDWTFLSCISLTSITIPSSVTSIGYGMFYNCSSLTSIIIPSSITSIGDMAFSYCSSLTSITIPSSITSIGGWAFLDCSSLTSITIPSSITSIDGFVFDGCSSLTDLKIPMSITSIGCRSFGDCTFLMNLIIPSSVTFIANCAFEGCTSLSITIPSSVTHVEFSAFNGWTASQTIYIEGYSSAPLTWSQNWDDGCSAKIVWNA